VELSKLENLKFIRYPGGKQRLLDYLLPYLPTNNQIPGIYIEPFLGGGAIFFAINPLKAILSDLNDELMDLYRGIKYAPRKIWKLYYNFPSTKIGYYDIRDNFQCKRLVSRAARTLFLNRTCFKGMWRHNSKGEFNIGYGGQDRRWVIGENDLVEVSCRLKQATLYCSDFEKIINLSNEKDFIFLDPPYKPHEKECINEHFTNGKFTFEDHKRLANTLKRATQRGTKWALTTSNQKDIIDLFKGYNFVEIPFGTGEKPGIMTRNSGEILIYNYNEKEIFN